MELGNLLPAQTDFHRPSKQQHYLCYQAQILVP